MQQAKNNAEPTPVKSGSEEPAAIAVIEEEERAVDDASSGVSPSRYEAIASLDQEDEDEKWSDRTSIITKVSVWRMTFDFVFFHTPEKIRIDCSNKSWR